VGGWEVVPKRYLQVLRSTPQFYNPKGVLTTYTINFKKFSFSVKLADSSPIRRTARFLIRATFGAKSKILNNKRIERFGQLFREEYQKSIKGK